MSNEDEIARLLDDVRGRVSQLEHDQDALLNQVKDIMTVYETRVLGEIENLIETKIDPLDQVVSALMVTISDMFIKLHAFLDVYETDAPADFKIKVMERTKYWQQESLAAMRNYDEAASRKNDGKDAAEPDDREAGSTESRKRSADRED